MKIDSGNVGNGQEKSSVFRAKMDQKWVKLGRKVVKTGSKPVKILALRLADSADALSMWPADMRKRHLPPSTIIKRVRS